MNQSLKHICQFLFLILVPGITNASDGGYSPMKFELLEHDCGAAGCIWIEAEGLITQDTPRDFKVFLSNIDYIPPIYFSGPGGNLGAAIELAKIIRAKGFDTNIAGNNPCFSACAYAFLGGVSRSIDESGEIGIHRFRSSDGDAGEELAQITTADLSRFLDSMGVDRKLLDYASYTSAENIYAIPLSLAQALNIDNTNPPIGTWKVNVTDEGVLIACVSQRQSRKNGIVTFCLDKSEINLKASVIYQIKQEFRDEQALQYIFSHEQSVTIRIRQTDVINYENKNWRRLGKDTFAVQFDVSESQMELLLAEKEFEFYPAFSQAIRDVSPIVVFSTKDLYKSYTALLRQQR